MCCVFISDYRLSVIVLITRLNNKGDNLSPYFTPLLDGILGSITLP